MKSPDAPLPASLEGSSDHPDGMIDWFSATFHRALAYVVDLLGIEGNSSTEGTPKTNDPVCDSAEGHACEQCSEGISLDTGFHSTGAE